MKQTFTEGNIAKSLIKFSIPLICASILQQLYAWVDAIIVGNMLGEVYLSGLGATTALVLMLNCLISGFVIGASIVIAKLFGEKKTAEFRTITSSFFVFMVGVFAIVAVVGFFLTRNILLWLDTPTEVIDIAEEYMKIIFLGLPFVAGYNALAGSLRGVGDSKIGMYVLVVAIAIDAILNPIFIAIFEWGITGVAVATVISQAVSLLLVAVYMERKHKYMAVRFKKQYLKVKQLISVIKKGLPLAVQMSLVSIGWLVLQAFANSFGYDVATGIATAYRIDVMILSIVVSTADSISVFVSQNLGAGNPKRALKGGLVGGSIVVGSAIITTIVIVLCGSTFLKMFGVSDAVLQIGTTFFLLNGSFYFLYGIYESCMAFLQGQGRVVSASIVALSAIIVRIVLSYALRDIVGWRIISFAEISCWLFGAVLSIILCVIAVKQNEKIYSIKN